MQFITTLILVRLLSPSDFGLLSMSMVVIGFTMLFNDLGTKAAVIQNKNLSTEALSSIFWLNVSFGLVATLVLYAISHGVSFFFHEPELQSVLQLLSLSPLITSSGILHQALLERDLEFNRLAKLEITSVLAGSLAGISMAFLGYGVWSLVFQTLTTTLFTAFLLWVSSVWRPRLLFHWNEIRSIKGFILNLTGFNIFNYFARNADDILVGRYLGSQDLGYYNLAYRLLLYPLRNISSVISRVMFPVYSQVQNDDARFRMAYLKVTGAISLVTFPLMLGLMALAEPFVLTFFGSDWEPIILLLIILAPLGMVQSIGTTVGAIYQAKGRTDWMFRWGIASGSLAVIAFIIGLQWGIVGVAAAYAIVGVILTYPNFAIPFRLIKLPMRELIQPLWRPFLCAFIMFTIITGIKLMLPKDFDNFWTLSFLFVAGGLTYLILSWQFNRRQVSEVIRAL